MDTDQLETMETSAAIISQVFWSFSTAKALHMASRYGILKLIGDQPYDSVAIAHRTGLDVETVDTLMWTLQSINAVVKRPSGRFALTDIGSELLDYNPDLTNLSEQTFLSSVWSDPLGTTLDNAPVYSTHASHHLIDDYGSRYSDVDLFHSVMAAGNQGVYGDLLNVFDFSEYDTVAEIGGGHGDFLQIILGLGLKTRGVLYDLPIVVAEAKMRWRPALADRCSFIGVQLLDKLKMRADLCLISQVMQAWSDEQLGGLLANCLDVSRRLVLVDQLLDSPGDEQSYIASMFQNLNLLPSSRRTGCAYSDLLDGAGYQLRRIVPAGRLSLIEAVAK